MLITLTILTYLAKAVLGAALLVALVYIGIHLHDQITEFCAVSRAERKKRKNDDDAFFTGMLEGQRAHFKTAMEKPLWRPKQSR